MALSSRQILFLALLLDLLLASASGATVLRGRVVGVADGDTITVLDGSHVQHRIRLAGIDAPELSQAFGRVAKANMSRLVFGRDVAVVVTKTDRYSRLVGKVLVDGRDACLEEVRAGLAWFYIDYESELSPGDRAAYAAAEREASAAKRGLWSDPNRMPPWQYRRTHRNRYGHSVKGGNRLESLSHTGAAPTVSGAIIGNRRSGIYHRPDCPGYDKVGAANRVVFRSEAEAIAAGYRKARNCP